MSHEGRMARGEANFNSGKLLNNNDTLYFLANRPKEVVKEEIKKEKKNAKSTK